MAKTDNLGDFLTDVANSIRTKTGTTELINAQDFSDKILNISSGGSTLKTLLDATKSTKYLFEDYQGTSVDDLIHYSDTENVTNMYYMFYNCGRLTTIPQFNTSNVTNMNNMFNGCSFLESIPLLDTGNVTNMYYMFYNCGRLTTIPQFNTSNVTNMNNMFNGCSFLESIPLLDTGNVTNMNNIFASCRSLKSVLMTNIGVSLDISASTLFERSDLVTILNNLKTVTTTKTLKMGATNLAKLTDEDKAIATNKGWTLA